jgi:hypothetical protein
LYSPVRATYQTHFIRTTFIPALPHIWLILFDILTPCVSRRMKWADHMMGVVNKRHRAVFVLWGNKQPNSALRRLIVEVSK